MRRSIACHSDICLLFIWVFSLLTDTCAQKNYTFEDLEPCSLNTVQISKLGPDDELEPCIIFEVEPGDFVVRPEKSSTISLVQVTPSGCGNHRDGAVTGVQSLNSDNGAMGVAIGFNNDHYVSFHLVSIVAGNPANLSEDEYDRRHVQILKSAMSALDSPYIVGSCSFASAIEKEPARELKAIVMAQVGPPGFYTEGNPYVFGFHINSDTYPLPNVQSLSFLAQELEGGASKIPVRVIYRTKSEFFYSTCRSAIDTLQSQGFVDMKEILYDHAGDHDGDGDKNQFDEDFLIGLADEACPPRSAKDEDFHPALFLCTLTEQDIILKRWLENGCRPVSTWVTASTWGWANANPGVVPYFQGGGQWHAAFSYSDRYFETGKDLLLHNEQAFGYLGNYDQVVSYAIPVLYSQHLVAHYQVTDNPDPVADFKDETQRELLRRSMVVLNVESLFGPVSFNEFQRNIGRGAAGTQWLPVNADGTFTNALVAPFLQAEASTVLPASSSLPCNAGDFVNETMRINQGSLLNSGCTECPVDTFTLKPSLVQECTPCPPGSSTEDLIGESMCIVRDDNLLPNGIITFGYLATCTTWILSICFIFWLVFHRQDPVVKVSQIEFLLLICIGAICSSSTVIALTFQAGTDEDTSAATIGCTVAPFLYAIGWVLQYSSLSAKTYRLFKITQGTNSLTRVTVTFCQMFRVVVACLSIDLIILISWIVMNPLVYERSEGTKNVDEETGVVTISSVGRCVPEDEGSFWVFAGPLMGFHVFLVVCTNVLLYNVKNITERYQEQKYVAMASMLMFEILIVGIPVMVAVSDNPEATFIVLTGIVALDDIGILCCIFLPKIKFQRKGLEEGVGVGESIMRETHRRASTREAAKNESSVRWLTTGAPDDDNSPSILSKRFSASDRDSFAMRVGFDKSISVDDSIKEETSEELEREQLNPRIAVRNEETKDKSLSVDDSIKEETPEEVEREQSNPRIADPNEQPKENQEQAPTNNDLVADEKIKGLEAEEEMQGGNSDDVSTNVPAPAAAPASSTSPMVGASGTENNKDHEQMVEMTSKLLEEHERMMKATANIMKEHESMKLRLLEQQRISQSELSLPKTNIVDWTGEVTSPIAKEGLSE